MILQLTKQSTDQEIKAYFEEVLRMSRDSEEFPVNLDDVWPLVYAEKGKAVRALKSNLLISETPLLMLNGSLIIKNNYRGHEGHRDLNISNTVIQNNLCSLCPL